MLLRLEWQSGISHLAHTCKTHHPFDHQFYLTVQYHFLLGNSITTGAQLIVHEWDRKNKNVLVKLFENHFVRRYVSGSSILSSGDIIMLIEISPLTLTLYCVTSDSADEATWSVHLWRLAGRGWWNYPQASGTWHTDQTSKIQIKVSLTQFCNSIVLFFLQGFMKL